ncbi:hypothetical protein [Caudoviricetes sp.]|nr:hypothetical protein [Caudoviricetes sp.]
MKDIYKQRLLKIADTIEANAQAFNLQNWSWPTWLDTSVHPCGSPSCVAGWANALANKNRRKANRVSLNDANAAAFYLGIVNPDKSTWALSDAEYAEERLFTAYEDSVWVKYAAKYGWTLSPYGGLKAWDQITGRQAAKVLRDLAYRKVRL